ncbi:hypothetical protein EV385_3131 [Krasilnikovia cinnamomea]|uniref:Uncharacterized protein n=1 Tax=Krasilnikovia cinnamomea TaxID=349313 RepID=A0A4V2G758_9ACTN|nr:hypothetical protein [Krasilnikovia cinnamomea]RZU51316.1 hypothetical protein EV385_3131 [Krasilnikovia cinnamomea]
MSIHPTALADQLHAASTDAHHRLLRAAEHPWAKLTANPDTPPWLASLFQRHALALLGGHGRTCPHLGPGPRVVHAFAWAPGLIVCPACRHLATPDPIEDSTCDRCRQHSERVWAGIAQVGPILFGYGLCDACHHDTE